MSERGSVIKRKLDFLLGTPLAAAAGGCRRLFRLASGHADLSAARRVGVLCLGAIGDLLLVSGLLRALQNALPQAAITIMSSRANAPALDLLHPAYARAVFRVTDVAGLVHFLRGASFDLLVDASQWARLGALVCACSGAGHTVGFATAGQYRHYAYDTAVEHRGDRHESENFLALARALFPGAAGTPELHLPSGPSPVCPVLPEGPLVFCHMWPSGLKAHLKEWPAASWAALARRLAEKGYAVAFTGGKQDAAATGAFLAAHLQREARQGLAVSLAGRISLADLACLMRQAAVVSVNTGVMHLAALSGAATVALNGPTNPARWGPLGPRARSLQPAQGYYGYLNLGFEYPDGADQALRRLGVDAVWTALEELGVFEQGPGRRA